MALVVYDRVQETTATTGTGTITLSGAVTGYQSFAVIGDGNTTFYCIINNAQWEVGLGTYSTTGPTLARTTVYSNSNGDTSPITLVGASNVFVTYPSEKSVNLDASGNVGPLGTITSGVWNGTTIPVAYGGTGVTASSGANSVVLRDSNANITANNLFLGFTSTVTAAGTTTLTVASTQYQRFTGTTTQTIKLPDATTLQKGYIFTIDNDSTGSLSIVDNASGAIDTIVSGTIDDLILLDTGTVAGTWVAYGRLPANYDFGATTASFGNATITNAVWNGTTIGTGYGGTGLTGFTAANNAIYSTSSSALTAGTLPVAAGGSGATTLTGYIYGNGTSAFTASTTIPTSALSGNFVSTFSAGTTGLTPSTGTAGAITLGGTLATTNGGTGLTSFTSGGAVYASSTSVLTTGTLPVSAGGTGATSTTANYVFAGPTTGSAAAPSFRALVAADIPSTYSEFASGTALLFQQTAAPTGWTKVTTYDNAALRVVSGTASSGGSVNFTSAFTSQSVTGSNAGYALTTTDIPAHNHGISDPGHAHSVYDPGHSHGQNVGYTCNNNHVHCGVGGGAAENPNPLNGPGSGGASTFGSGTGIGIYGATTGISTTNTGSGGSHTHTFTGNAINLAVKYVDAIICTKN